MNMRWRWIEILPRPCLSSDLARFLSVAPKKPRLTLPKSLRLSPRDTLAYTWMTIAGIAKSSSRQLRASGRLVSTGDRGQPKLSDSIFPLGRRARAARSTGRGAFRSQGRPRAQPDLHRLPRPRRLDGEERRPDVSGLDRARSSKACARPESPNNDRARLAAILAIDVVRYSRLMGEDEAGTRQPH